MDEMLTLKMNLLGGMNAYVVERLTDEKKRTLWHKAMGQWAELVTEDDLRRVAGDRIKWTAACETFGYLVDYITYQQEKEKG